jgi:flagellar hook-basal body complex protein FliE
MRIQPGSFSELPNVETATPAPSTSAAEPSSFASEVLALVSSVSEQQQTAEVESAQLAQGAGNIHETALALEKADVGMRLMMKGRNKIIEAYQEISRMPL